MGVDLVRIGADGEDDDDYMYNNMTGIYWLRKELCSLKDPACTALARNLYWELETTPDEIKAALPRIKEHKPAPSPDTHQLPYTTQEHWDDLIRILERTKDVGFVCG